VYGWPEAKVVESDHGLTEDISETPVLEDEAENKHHGWEADTCSESLNHAGDEVVLGSEWIFPHLEGTVNNLSWHVSMNYLCHAANFSSM
jgi:hypothetical protein